MRLLSTPLLFSLLMLGQVGVNYDTGALAPMYGLLMEILRVSPSELGSMNAAPYLGLIAGSVIGGYTLHKNPRREKVLVVSCLSLNALCVLLFTSSLYWKLLWLSYLSKSLIGFTQAVFVLFIPLWTHTNAPKNRKALWMGLVQGGVVAGTCVGYVVGGALTASHTVTGIAFTMLIQVVILCLVTFLLALFVPKRQMYLTEDSTQLHTIHEDHSLSLVSTSENVPQKPGNMMNSSNAFATSLSFMVPVSTKGSLVWLEQRPAWQVFFDPLYAGVLAAVCAIYFVVTGVQSWTTLYMQQVLHAPMPFIVTSFATVAATSPLMGVIVGGIVTDKVGGYQTMKALKRTVGTISLTSFCAAAVAAGAAFNHEKISFIVMIWIALFLGAMCMPALIGIMFSCVPPDHRTTSSSVILVTTNCLGFALGAWLPGFVMSFTSIATGYSVVLLWASLGCLATTIAGIRVFCSTSGCKGTDSLSVPSIDDSDLGIVPQPDDSEAQWCSSESISNETLSVTST